MKTKSGRIFTVALLLLVALLHIFSQEYVSASAWGSLGIAVALSGERKPAGQKSPKTPQQYLMLFFIVLAPGLFGYQLYHDLTDQGANSLPSTAPVLSSNSVLSISC
ncbi:hypothetical protein [Sabulibacter ruber]|uniref:hypothetical protein n=1 Tax=Sabulibacter ruber TaxID=2811901 RepID=UPI001A9748B2|nr:hypothetical protein [Sabulibacter ruber]